MSDLKNYQAQERTERRRLVRQKNLYQYRFPAHYHDNNYNHQREKKTSNQWANERQKVWQSIDAAQTTLTSTPFKGIGHRAAARLARSVRAVEKEIENGVYGTDDLSATDTPTDFDLNDSDDEDSINQRQSSSKNDQLSDDYNASHIELERRNDERIRNFRSGAINYASLYWSILDDLTDEPDHEQVTLNRPVMFPEEIDSAVICMKKVDVLEFEIALDNRFVRAIYSPKGDGNCGFRCAAQAYLGSEDRWGEMKDQMLKTYNENPGYYSSDFANDSRIATIQEVLSRKTNCFADRWWFDHGVYGQILADTTNQPVVVYVSHEIQAFNDIPSHVMQEAVVFVPIHKLEIDKIHKPILMAYHRSHYFFVDVQPLPRHTAFPYPHDFIAITYEGIVEQYEIHETFLRYFRQSPAENQRVLGLRRYLNQ